MAGRRDAALIAGIALRRLAWCRRRLGEAPWRGWGRGRITVIIVAARPLLASDRGDVAAELALVAEAGQGRAGEGVQRRPRRLPLRLRDIVPLRPLLRRSARRRADQKQHRESRPEFHRAASPHAEAIGNAGQSKRPLPSPAPGLASLP